MQKMSNSLEMIQQILQVMTIPHPSPAPLSSTSEHPPISQSASWNWPDTWWTAPFGWICPPMNTAYFGGTIFSSTRGIYFGASYIGGR
ncbi:hypothetical protein COCNU_scaffold004395G000010 [Cocos nucifera]|nr:hypothetical protein [Cocos nucifera]